MYVRVDVEYANNELEGFSYSNEDSRIEFVTLRPLHVNIQDGGSGKMEVYYEDIPNLIKALKAAYKHKTGNTL